MVESLFSTITNANFDREVFIEESKGLELRQELKEQVIKAGGNLENSNANKNG